MFAQSDSLKVYNERIFKLQGLFRKNLQITGLESTLFFTGGKPKLAQITEGKDILTP